MDLDGRLPPLVLVGGGKMGTALLAGWRRRGSAGVFVVDPSAAAQALGGDGVTVVAAPESIPASFAAAAVVLAVKPQAAAGVVPAYARFAARAVFISIMAGQTLSTLGRLLGQTAAVVRAMPNTPAAIGQGMTVAVAGPGVTADQRALATALLAAAGRMEWVDDEGLLDPVTAISGGGPAYLFLLTELLEAAGIEQGLPPALARLLARQTMIGSAGLLAASDADAAALRQAVTSAGGTTAQALQVLMQGEAWPKLISEAIAAASRRSRELGD